MHHVLHLKRKSFMEKGRLPTIVNNERLAAIIERCLASQSAYKLFDTLAAVARLDLQDRMKYMELVKESGVYTEEEIRSVERLILSGTAQYFKEVIDQVREEWVQREIGDMLT